MADLLKKRIKEFMTKKVIAVREDETIKALFQLMDRHAIVGVPVTDGANRVVGIVTESDLIRHFTTLKTPRGLNILGSIVYLDNLQDFNRNLKEHCAEYVKDLMHSPVVTLRENSTLKEALDVMAENKVNRLPVVDAKDHLTGMVTRTDIVHQLAQLETV